MPINNLNIEIIPSDQFWNVVQYMPNPNEILTDHKGFVQTIKDMKKDPKIGSHLRMRKDIVASLPWRITQADSPDNVFELIKNNLREKLNWEQDIKEFLSAIEYGYSLSEVLWRERESYWLPDSLKNRKPENIRFKTFIEESDGGKKSIWLPFWLPENKVLEDKYKFLVYRNNPEAEDPYGTSDLMMCYWPWRFKQLGWEFWLEAARKCGAPSIVALFDSNDIRDATEKAKILSESLAEIEGGSGVALANVKEIQKLEMTGNLQDFQTLINTCNAEISFALTTQTLSTQEGEFGTRAQATVHDSNLLRVCYGDAKALAGTLQCLIDWMVEINFGKNIPSPKGEFDLKAYASLAEVILAIDAGIPVSKSTLYDRYALPQPKDEADVFLKPASLSQPDLIGLSDSKKKLKIR